MCLYIQTFVDIHIWINTDIGMVAKTELNVFVVFILDDHCCDLRTLGLWITGFDVIRRSYYKGACCRSFNDMFLTASAGICHEAP